MSMQQIIDFMSNYVDVKNEELEAMLERVHFCSIKKRDYIQRQGEYSKKMMFILKGSARHYYTDDKGIEHTTGFSLENSPVVAYHSFMNETPAEISIVALEETEMVWTSRAEFHDFLEVYPQYEAGLRKVLGAYLARQGNHSLLLRIDSSRKRYESFCEQQPEIIKRVPLKYIASYLRMALETLSRVRAGKL